VGRDYQVRAIENPNWGRLTTRWAKRKDKTRKKVGVPRFPSGGPGPPVSTTGDNDTRPSLALDWAVGPSHEPPKEGIDECRPDRARPAEKSPFLAIS
jgi:hypothetical protein